MVRKATIEDLQEIFQLNKQLKLKITNFPWVTKPWIRKMISEDNFYILEVEGKVVGAICLKLDNQDNKGLYIESIAIGESLHGLGYGKQLIDFAKSNAKNKGKTSLRVESFIDYHLKEFYKKCGFDLDIPPTGQHQGKKFYRFISAV